MNRERELIGREEEMRMLESLYGRKGSVTYAVYGRRRVGKSFLLTRFCRGKRSLFITAPMRCTRDDMTASLSRQVSEQLGCTDIVVSDMPSLVSAIDRMDGEDKAVVVLDEFPEIVRTFPLAADDLKTYMDGAFQDRNIMLIVCGSSMSAMAEELNDPKGPLYERFPLQLLVSPLGYRDARRFNPGISEEDRIRTYCIASGIPLYQEMFGDIPTDRAVRDLFLGKTSYMRLEAGNIVSMELRSDPVYEKILKTIGTGADFGHLRNVTGIPPTTLQTALGNLEAAGFLRKVTCFGMKRKNQYRFSEGFLAFNYGLLAKNEDMIFDTDREVAFESLRSDIHSFYGHGFEEVCRQYVRDTRRTVGIGDWWGPVVSMNDGVPERDENGRVVSYDADIDIVARVMDGDNLYLLLGECKFTGKRTGIRELQALVDRGRMIGWEASRRYILFSRSGFTDSLLGYLDEHEELDVELVDMDRLTGWAETGVTNP